MSYCAITGEPVSAVYARFFRGRADEPEPARLRLLMTAAELEVCVQEAARQMNAFYCPLGIPEEAPVELIFLLTGAYYFGGLLTRYLRFPYAVHFVKIKSYDGTTQKEVSFNQSDLLRFKGSPHIVLVDELIDSGTTMHVLLEFLPHARICACLSKNKVQMAHFLGFPTIPPDAWLIGFGLDDNGTKRGWAHLFVLHSTDEKVGAFRTAMVARLKALQQAAAGEDVYAAGSRV